MPRVRWSGDEVTGVGEGDLVDVGGEPVAELGDNIVNAENTCQLHPGRVRNDLE